MPVFGDPSTWVLVDGQTSAGLAGRQPVRTFDFGVRGNYGPPAAGFWNAPAPADGCPLPKKALRCQPQQAGSTRHRASQRTMTALTDAPRRGTSGR